MRDHSFGGDRHELLVVPVRPGSPLFLYGEGALLWLRLVDAALDESVFDESERQILTDMEQMGIVSRDVGHSARVQEIRGPWLSSPMHELVYSLLGWVAAAEEIDILFIKGPTLHAQGLRDREHSGDVDCWVRPADEIRLARAMQEWGWKPAFSAFTGTRVLHSLTLRVGDWGSAIDVHTWFPGIAMDADDAFALVSEKSDVRVFAGYDARTPTTDMHAIISALHDVRPLQGRMPTAQQVGKAGDVLRRGGRTVPSLVRDAGAEYALAAALRRAFPEFRLDLDNAAVPKDWAWRLADSPLHVYFEAIKLVPPRQRLRVFFRVLWPTAESLRSGPYGDDTTSTSVIRIRRAMQGWRLLHRAKSRA